MTLVASQNHMPQPARIGLGAFAFAGLSYIPVLGLPFGLAAMTWGLLSKRPGRWTVMVASGIAVALYGSLLGLGLAHHGGA